MGQDEMEDSLTWDALDQAEECQIGELMANSRVRLVLEFETDLCAPVAPTTRVIAF